MRELAFVVVVCEVLDAVAGRVAGRCGGTRRSRMLSSAGRARLVHVVGPLFSCFLPFHGGCFSVFPFLFACVSSV